jgi:hypothetical protein
MNIGIGSTRRIQDLSISERPRRKNLIQMIHLLFLQPSRDQRVSRNINHTIVNFDNYEIVDLQIRSCVKFHNGLDDFLSI